MKRRAWVVLAVLLGVWACGRSAERADGTAAGDTLTRREKDSLISTLPVPGAGRIMDAREAADRAAERAAQHDTVR